MNAVYLTHKVSTQMPAHSSHLPTSGLEVVVVATRILAQMFRWRHNNSRLVTMYGMYARYTLHGPGRVAGRHSGLILPPKA